MQTIEKTCLNGKEAAKFLGLSETTTLELLRAKKIPSFKVGTKYVIPVDTLKEWANHQAKMGVNLKED